MAPNAASTTPWPHGALFPIQLGPVSWPLLVAGDDTSGYKKLASFKTLFAFDVKQAFFWMGESSWVDGSGSAFLMRVRDDTGTPQTIISALTVATAHDAGTWTTLTVNDEGPILNNAEIFLEIDNDTAGEGVALTVLLWVSPTFAPSGLDGPL